LVSGTKKMTKRTQRMMMKRKTRYVFIDDCETKQQKNVDYVAL
jgi:hypothetical protein